MNGSLKNKLDNLNRNDVLPMHMPGHKRNPSITKDMPCLAHDVTEIDGLDDLHRPQGIIRDLEKDFASLWDADDAIISVNGATAPIQSSILAHSRPKDRILVASNCHISVWHAIEIGDLVPVITDPSINSGVPFFGAVDPEAFEEKLKADPSVKLAVITSPTYEGFISDTEELTRIAHRYGCMLIVDEAHGAHLGITDSFPKAACGDITIKSLHKTLASPTQTAVALLWGDRADRRLMRHYMSVNESSSPSYILMEGLENSLRHLDTDSFYGNVLAGRKALSSLNNLTLFDPSQTYDPSKFVILTNGKINGHDLAFRLRNEYAIEVEASFPTHIIAMTGIGDTPETISRFVNAITMIDEDLDGEAEPLTVIPCPAGERDLVMTMREAIKAKGVVVPLEEAEGCIASESIFAYPPGVPLILSGERITQDAVTLLKALQTNGSALKTDPLRDFDGDVLKVDTNG